MHQTKNQSSETERIVRTYADMVYRLAYSYVRNRSDADDIFQETFLRYVRKKPKFESEAHCRAWLIRVTINCAKNHLTSAWMRHTQPLSDLVAATVPEEESRLDEALRQISPKYRAVIHLYYFEEYSTEEIAGILKCKPATVRSRLARAREKLKDILKEESL